MGVPHEALKVGDCSFLTGASEYEYQGFSWVFWIKSFLSRRLLQEKFPVPNHFLRPFPQHFPHEEPLVLDANVN